MSAICAILRFDGAPGSPADLAPLLEALRDYGPEAVSWTAEDRAAPVALGCRPWRVTPEDAWYRPPLRSADGRVVLVADARIDNRAEIAAELAIRAAEASQLPDAAFILAAYQAWGDDCARRLLGDFAFILWDAGRRSLFCARDGLGQRVLFYHASAARIALATSAQAVAALPDVRPRLNEQKVADFLVLYQEPDHTYFEGIRRVPAGHTLVANRDGIKTDRFWSPEPKRSILLGSDQEYVEGFRQVFGEAVRARVRCQAQVGVMVSGGLDSSSVAAVAARELREQGRRLVAFHAAPRLGFAGAVPRGWVADESGDVAAIAALHPNLDLEVHRSTGETLLDGIETSFRVTGAPARNPSNVPWFDGIYAAAQARNVRVLLAGHAGNATISHSGLRSLRDSARRGNWRHLWREVRAHARATGQPSFHVLRDQVLQPLRLSFLSREFYRSRRRHQAPIWESSSSAIRPDFARAMHVEDRLRAARRDQLHIHKANDLEYRIAVLNGPADGPDTYSGFRAWFGVETRDPTADLRVVDYCFSIPAAQYLRNGISRALVRRGMDGYLPDQVRLRRTLGAQAADWIEWFPALRGKFLAELDRLDRSETANRCLDLAKLRALVDRWPERLGVEHDADYKLLLLRGIMMGRFIRWFEETYS